MRLILTELRVEVDHVEFLESLEPSGFRRGFLNFGSPCEMKTRDLSERRSVLVLVPISMAFG
jgi:hypothetical protein